ncbi:MAG: FkbM family methyltransferase [Lachnospiraceae bacterium]
MKLENYMDIIKEAISYAEKEGIVTAYNWNETLKEKVVVAFGLGKFFRDTYERLFQMVDVKYVCDNDSTKWGKEFYGKKCISPSELSQIENVFVIIVMGDCRSVMKQLQTTPGGGIISAHISELHFSNYEKGKSCDWLENALSKIEYAIALLHDEESKDIFTKVFCNKIYLSSTNTPYQMFSSEGEYFDNGCWTLGENEYFVDGGAYIGDTVTEFVEYTKGAFGAVYSFEYEAVNYKRLSHNMKKFPQGIQEKIETFQCGIWDKRETGWCEYLGESDGTQLMTEDCKGPNAEQCLLDKLDDVLSDKKVTVLKMDIEGAEVQGLNGAKNIIISQKPKLAICLYHTPEHLWEIPLLIHEMRPDYKMIIRHHSVQNYTDTVLYAE